MNKVLANISLNINLRQEKLRKQSLEENQFSTDPYSVFICLIMQTGIPPSHENITTNIKQGRIPRRNILKSTIMSKAQLT